LTTENESLQAEVVKYKDNLDKVSRDKQSQDSELLSIKSKLNNMENEKSKNSEKNNGLITHTNNNNSELLIEKHIIKIQELETVIEKISKENENLQLLMTY